MAASFDLPSRRGNKRLTDAAAPNKSVPLFTLVIIDFLLCH